jgi:hypothetical protein
MALPDLRTREMLELSRTLVDKNHHDHQVFRSHPVMASLVPEIGELIRNRASAAALADPGVWHRSRENRKLASRPLYETSGKSRSLALPGPHPGPVPGWSRATCRKKSRTKSLEPTLLI